MARLPRYFLPGQPQHVIQRGNNRTPIFVTEDDYSCYLDCLVAATQQHGADIHAYVLMTSGQKKGTFYFLDLSPRGGVS